MWRLNSQRGYYPKGANALDMINRKAAVMIGHPEGGTIMAALTAVIGKDL